MSHEQSARSDCTRLCLLTFCPSISVILQTSCLDIFLSVEISLSENREGQVSYSEL
jgi:hypothetical protein